MSAEGPPQILKTDQERALLRKELKRCGVRYRVGPDLVRADLVLTDLDIVIENRDGGTVYKRILLEDFLGAEIFSTSFADVCRLEINSFPAKKLGSRNSRRLDVDSVLFPTTNAEEIRNMVEWRNALRQECERAVRKAFVFEEERTGDPAPVADSWKRRYLVFINPIAGSGNGVRNFKEHVQPMFELADIALDITITEYSGHAASVVKEYDLSCITGIVLCSGDGLLYEVINALMEREDWKTAIKIPLGVIPTGTGNALCASLMEESKEEFSLANAAFQIIRGGVRPMDLATVHAGGKVRHMAILSCWAFVADTDIDSENMRTLGKDTRYVLYSIKNIVQKKSYHGRLHYLPLEGDIDETDLVDYSTDIKQAGRSVCHSERKPQTLLQAAGAIDTVCDTASLGTSKEDRQITPPEEMNDVTLFANQAVDARNAASCPSSQNHHRYPLRIPLRFLPPTTESKLPCQWKTVEGDFVLFGVLMVPFVAEGFYGYPGVPLGSGYFTICYSLENLTRLDLLRILITGGTGKFMSTSEKVNVAKARAFRIEPLGPTGVITVDGEVMPYASTQGEIHQNFIRVYSRKRSS